MPPPKRRSIPRHRDRFPWFAIACVSLAASILALFLVVQSFEAESDVQYCAPGTRCEIDFSEFLD